MNGEFMGQLFLVAALIGGVAVTAGALVTKDGRVWSDWVMAAGSALATLGFFATSLAFFEISDWLQMHGEYPCLGSVCLGSMAFAVGFVVNQLRDRAEARHQQEMSEIATRHPQVSRPEGNTHD